MRWVDPEESVQFNDAVNGITGNHDAGIWHGGEQVWELHYLSKKSVTHNKPQQVQSDLIENVFLMESFAATDRED